ncbi:hypothetical protein GEMRC1_003913 [Eukaryota sp. GEM-RC1]
MPSSFLSNSVTENDNIIVVNDIPAQDDRSPSSNADLEGSGKDDSKNIKDSLDDLYDRELGPVRHSSRIETFTKLLSFLFFPLKHTVSHLEKYFGSTIGFYFKLVRTILGAVFLLSIYSSIFLVRHIIDLWQNDRSVLLETSSNYYPAVLLPSTIGKELQSHWSWVITIGYHTVLLFNGLFVVFAARLMYRNKAFSEGQSIGTPKFMNLIYSWDWSINNLDAITHQQAELVEDVKISLSEEDIRVSELALKKSVDGAFYLNFARAIAVFIFLVTFGLSVYVVYHIVFNHDDLVEKYGKWTWLEVVLRVGLPFVITGLNIVSPYFVRVIVFVGPHLIQLNSQLKD